MQELIRKRIQESIDLKKLILDNQEQMELLNQVSIAITNVLQEGGKLVICGNGGSASDALHFAGEIVGRFELERNPWPAIVLNADVATITAIANDYGYDQVFARQAQAHLQKCDMFVGISTSGNSENVLNAVKVAEQIGCKSVALLGKDGGAIKELATYPIIVPSNSTARIQECHIMMIHIICELVETRLSHRQGSIK